MRFLLRAIFWLALAYALIPARAPVPASLKASAPPAPEHTRAPAEATGNNSDTSLARDAIALCLDNTEACAAGVEAVSKVAEMARAAGARFTDAAPQSATTPAATTPAAGPSPATRATPVPLPQDRPGDRR